MVPAVAGAEAVRVVPAVPAVAARVVPPVLAEPAPQWLCHRYFI